MGFIYCFCTCSFWVKLWSIKVQLTLFEATVADVIDKILVVVILVVFVVVFVVILVIVVIVIIALVIVALLVVTFYLVISNH